MHIQKSVVSGVWASIRPVLMRFGENQQYSIRQGLAKGMKQRGGVRYIPRFLTPEERFLKKLNFSGQTVYDVGGCEGHYSMFFSKAVGRSGRVICFEPHPRNCATIRENLKINNISNVDIYSLGLGSKREKTSFTYITSNLACGTAVKETSEFFMSKKDAETVECQIDSLDNLIAELPTPDFIKIDVEGMELDVLMGMTDVLRRYRPSLNIEIHAISLGDHQSKLRNGQRIIDFLRPKGYSITHVQTEAEINEFYHTKPGPAHFYCKYSPPS